MDSESPLAPTEKADRDEPSDAADLEELRVRAEVERRLLDLEPEPLRIGRFNVLSKLGEGGMGVVYSGFDEELNRRVAIKILLDTANDEATVRMRREAQAMARLSHPNVVQVYEVGDWRGQLFVAMEFIEGVTLRAWLDSEPRAWRDVLEVFVQAGRGLAAAHTVGLIHRDFKPDNVMVDKDGRARVLDFGIARTDTVEDPMLVSAARSASGTHAADSGAKTLTLTGTIMGTPRYMAPEQHLGRPTDARSDQFSLCVALYEALYDGKRPFEGNDLIELSDSVAGGSASEPPKNSSVPKWVGKSVMRGLSTAPRARWPSMEELEVALTRDPGRVRRRWGLGLGLVSLVGGAFGMQEVNEAGVLTQCQAESNTIDATWNDKIREELESSFLRVGFPYAEAAWQGVNEEFTEHARDWKVARESVCQQFRVRKTMTPATRERAIHCLEDRRASLSELTEIFADADSGVAQNALQAAQALRDPNACTSPVLLEQEPPIPEDAETRDRVVTSRRQLQRARTLHALGRHPAGLKVASRMVEYADQLEYAPLRAEALLVVGQIENGLSHYGRSKRALEAAYFEALEWGLDPIAAAAATKLTVVVGFRYARHDEGLVWARHARLLYDRLEGSDVGVATLENATGLIYNSRAEYDESIKHFQAALKLRQQTLGLDHPDVAEVWQNLGVAHRGRGAYDEAQKNYEKALALLERTMGADFPQCKGPHLGLGKIARSHGDHEAAIRHFGVARDVTTKAFGEKHGAAISAQRDIGETYRRLGQFQKAIDTLEATIRVHDPDRLPRQSKATMTLRSLGDAYSAVGRYDDASELIERALSLSSAKMGADHPQTAWIRAARARLELRQGSHRAALRDFTSAREALEERLGDSPGLIGPLLGAAESQLALDRAVEALPILERALALTVANRVDPRTEAKAKWLLARALWDASSGQDRDRASAVAGEAKLAIADLDDPAAAEVRARLDAWLKDHVD